MAGEQTILQEKTVKLRKTTEAKFKMLDLKVNNRKKAQD